MRKILIGVFIGFALSFAVGAHAEIINMVGKTVEGQFPVKINGKLIDNQAAVVDGTSYLPVRAIGDALNMDVSFNADLGIELKKKGEPVLTTTTVDQEEAKRQLKLYDLRKQSSDLTKQIEEMYKIIAPYENVGYYNGKVGYEKEKDSIYLETKKKREDSSSQRDEIEKQIRDIHDQQAQINAQKMEQLRNQPNQP